MTMSKNLLKIGKKNNMKNPQTISQGEIKEETVLTDKIIVRKKNGYAIWADECTRLDDGTYLVKYTTKEGKAKIVQLANDQVAEIEQNA